MKCRDVVSVNKMTRRLRCPRCRRKPILYGGPTAGGQQEEVMEPQSDLGSTSTRFGPKEGARYACPRCEKHTLAFSELMMFD
jgi:DNA-directed RNA polymerase subunit RPC12/RpoP